MTLMRKKKKNFVNLMAKDGKPHESPSSTALDTPCSSSTPSPSPSSSSPTTLSATSSRYDSSLSLLTKKFIKLIISTSGDIDLKQAAILLNVQKRRIYDITNVLEGIHLIEKVSKNHVRWIGNQVKEANPPFPHQKKRQQEQQQKQLLRQQKQERLRKLKSANKELELEHEKLVQLEQSMLKSTSRTLGHPQCYLRKTDVDQFLSSHSTHPSHSSVITKDLPSYPPPFHPHDDAR